MGMSSTKPSHAALGAQPSMLMRPCVSSAESSSESRRLKAAKLDLSPSSLRSARISTRSSAVTFDVSATAKSGRSAGACLTLGRERQGRRSRRRRGGPAVVAARAVAAAARAAAAAARAAAVAARAEQFKVMLRTAAEARMALPSAETADQRPRPRPRAGGGGREGREGRHPPVCGGGRPLWPKRIPRRRKASRETLEPKWLRTLSLSLSLSLALSLRAAASPGSARPKGT